MAAAPPMKFTFVAPTAKSNASTFLPDLDNDRKSVAGSVMEFPFNQQRCRVLSKAEEVPEKSSGVVYWMSRDQRVQDNWAMLYAQRLALQKKISLHICFCLVPNFMDAVFRHYKFMLDGLAEVQSECNSLNVQFHLLEGDASSVLPGFVKANNIGAVISDFSPLRSHVSWVEEIKKALPENVFLCQVDAHNIVPCWIASDSLVEGPSFLRNKLKTKLPDFLTKFPPVIKHPCPPTFRSAPIDWSAVEASLQVDRTVEPVTWATPGTTAGLKELDEFCQKRLMMYGAKRNDPTVNAVSNLSPWLHFGQVSAQRAMLEVNKFRSRYTKSVESFENEAVTWRELSDNLCFYNKHYDSIEGTHDWAKATLELHKKDKRPYMYTQEELDKAHTHDDLWNAAQIQLVQEGKMHGFLRMYWAKKILEWTVSPEEALRIAIYLNDRYNLDGRDPNGYAGCMWSICGNFDRGFDERKVFGKIRYMTYFGCTRKFDVGVVVKRYGTK